jgi:hypothetical protein
MGEERLYPSVRNNPALAKRLNLRTVEEAVEDEPELQEQFLCNRTPEHVLRAAGEMPCDDLRYFFAERTDAFREASPQIMAYLREARADCPWGKWGTDG